MISVVGLSLTAIYRFSLIPFIIFIAQSWLTLHFQTHVQLCLAKQGEAFNQTIPSYYRYIESSSRFVLAKSIRVQISQMWLVALWKTPNLYCFRKPYTVVSIVEDPSANPAERKKLTQVFCIRLLEWKWSQRNS